MYLKLIQQIVLVAAVISLCGCHGGNEHCPDTPLGPVDIVLPLRNCQTRTAYDDGSGRFGWQSGDRISVWAKSSAGDYVLDGQPFSLLATGADNSYAYFSATLDSPMPDGTYSYFMSYPVPVALDGVKAVFRVPSRQDGLASGGVDIVVADPVVGKALAPIPTAAPIDESAIVKVTMRHLLHFLRFYIPKGSDPFGEPLTEIEFTMPKDVTGDLSVDVTDASSASLSGGGGSVILDLVSPIGVDESAVAGIVPPAVAYSSGEMMCVTVYSENKWSELPPVSLEGRNFAAGHITPVPIRPTDVRTLYQIKFSLDSNNLGEDPQSIKLTLPEGVKWPGSDSNVLDFAAGHDGLIKVGDTFVLKVKDEAAFRALSSNALTVTYESESAIVAENLAFGDLSSVSSASFSLNCPYLFFEDFSGVGDQSSHDEWSMANAGSKSPETFLGGWSAARFGTKAGTSLRLACRRETSADYTARADSPFLAGLKNGVTVGLEVDFDYSMDRKEYATPLVKLPEVGQTVRVGYITTSENLESGDDTGDFQSSFFVKETGGSYTNIGHNYSVVLTNVTSPLRLSWLTAPEHKAGTTNSTCWLYIDNIKVKIKK